MTSGRTDEPTAGAERGSPDSPSGTLPWRRIAEQYLPEPVKRHFGAQVALVVLGVALALCLASVLAYSLILGATEADARDEITSTTQLRASTVGEWVVGHRARTELVADRLSGGEVDAEAMDQYLSTVIDQGGGTIAGIHYVEAGRIVASTREGYDGRAVSSLDVPWGELSPGQSVAVTERAYAVSGRPAMGFVVAAGSGRIVLTSYLPRAFAGGTDVTVDAALLTRTGQRVAGAPGIEGPPEGTLEGGTTTVRADGAIVAYAPVEGADWLVAAAAPPSSLTGLSVVVGASLAFVVLGGLAALCVGGFVLTRGTVGALEELRRRTAEIEGGDLAVDLSTHREDEVGHLYEAVASMRDALRQQVQQAREAKREAESSHREMERQNRRLDQFASTLSHDLRNPLAVARGHVELLAAKLDDEDHQEHVSKVDGAHDRIDSIIDDVLTLTREGESVEDGDRFELRAVAEEAWRNVDNRDATLEIDDSIAIDGDRTRVLRAFENLFRNAIDHVGDDVTVTVGLTRDGFYVEDDGPGIPDDEMDTVFEYGHTTSDDGTGLGLSIVKTIAEAHGWSLWVDGTTGGARFVFSDVFASEERVFEQSAFTWEHARTD